MQVLKPESRELACVHDARQKGRLAGSTDRNIRGDYDAMGWFQVAGLDAKYWEIFEEAYKEAYDGRQPNN